MEVVKKKNGIFLPNLGMAAASFAAFLRILTLDSPPNLAVKATEDFSIGIPLLFACFFLPKIKENSWLAAQVLRYFLLWLSSIFVVFGNLLCLQGIYKCFMIVSPLAGRNFSKIGVFIFILVIIGGTYELVESLIKAIWKKDIEY